MRVCLVDQAAQLPDLVISFDGVASVTPADVLAHALAPAVVADATSAAWRSALRARLDECVRQLSDQGIAAVGADGNHGFEGNDVVLVVAASGSRGVVEAEAERLAGQISCGDVTGAEVVLKRCSDPAVRLSVLTHAYPLGMRPLNEAVASNNVSLVKMLLRHGARTTDADASGLSALHVAARRGFDMLAADLAATPAPEPPDIIPVMPKYANTYILAYRPFTWRYPQDTRVVVGVMQLPKRAQRIIMAALAQPYRPHRAWYVFRLPRCLLPLPHKTKSPLPLLLVHHKAPESVIVATDPALITQLYHSVPGSCIDLLTAAGRSAASLATEYHHRGVLEKLVLVYQADATLGEFPPCDLVPTLTSWADVVPLPPLVASTPDAWGMPSSYRPLNMTPDQEKDHLFAWSKAVQLAAVLRRTSEQAVLSAVADPVTRRTLLHWAVHTGSVMRDLLERGVCDVNARDASDATPLHLAVRACKPDAVRALLDAGASIDVQDCTGATPLHTCLVVHAGFEIASVLLDAARARNQPPTRLDKQQVSPLHIAVAMGNADVAGAIISTWPKAVGVRDPDDGPSVLMEAIRMRRWNMVPQVIPGSDIHAVGPGKTTALLYAVRCGSTPMPVLRALLAAGAGNVPGTRPVLAEMASRACVPSICMLNTLLLHHSCRDRDVPAVPMSLSAVILPPRSFTERVRRWRNSLRKRVSSDSSGSSAVDDESVDSGAGTQPGLGWRDDDTAMPLAFKAMELTLRLWCRRLENHDQPWRDSTLATAAWFGHRDMVRVLVDRNTTTAAYSVFEQLCAVVSAMYARHVAVAALLIINIEMLCDTVDHAPFLAWLAARIGAHAVVVRALVPTLELWCQQQQQLQPPQQQLSVLAIMQAALRNGHLRVAAEMMPVLEALPNRAVAAATSVLCLASSRLPSSDAAIAVLGFVRHAPHAMLVEAWADLNEETNARWAVHASLELVEKLAMRLDDDPAGREQVLTPMVAAMAIAGNRCKQVMMRLAAHAFHSITWRMQEWPSVSYIRAEQYMGATVDADVRGLGSACIAAMRARTSVLAAALALQDTLLARAILDDKDVLQPLLQVLGQPDPALHTALALAPVDLFSEMLAMLPPHSFTAPASVLLSAPPSQRVAVTQLMTSKLGEDVVMTRDTAAAVLLDPGLYAIGLDADSGSDDEYDPDADAKEHKSLVCRNPGVLGVLDAARRNDLSRSRASVHEAMRSLHAAAVLADGRDASLHRIPGGVSLLDAAAWLGDLACVRYLLSPRLRTRALVVSASGVSPLRLALCALPPLRGTRTAQHHDDAVEYEDVALELIDADPRILAAEAGRKVSLLRLAADRRAMRVVERLVKAHAPDAALPCDFDVRHVVPWASAELVHLMLTGRHYACSVLRIAVQTCLWASPVRGDIAALITRHIIQHCDPLPSDLETIALAAARVDCATVLHVLPYELIQSSTVVAESVAKRHTTMLPYLRTASPSAKASALRAAIRAGADANAVVLYTQGDVDADADDWFALACEYGCTEMAKAAMPAKIDTVPMSVIELGRSAIARECYQRGADVTMTQLANSTPWLPERLRYLRNEVFLVPGREQQLQQLLQSWALSANALVALLIAPWHASPSADGMTCLLREMHRAGSQPASTYVVARSVLELARRGSWAVVDAVIQLDRPATVKVLSDESMRTSDGQTLLHLMAPSPPPTTPDLITRDDEYRALASQLAVVRDRFGETAAQSATQFQHLRFADWLNSL